MADQNDIAVINRQCKKLLSSIASGDKAAFHEFYQLTSSRTYGYCLKMTKEVPVATQLLQDTYIAIWDTRKSLQPTEHSLAFVTRMASRQVYRYFQNKKRTTDILEKFDTPSLLGYSTNRSSSETAEILLMIEISVLQLPDIDAQVFRYAKYDGWTTQEIALCLSLSTEEVEQIIDRAMRSVRARVLGEN